ncbi:MAG: ribosome-associated translation inhibitor RaiA [Actinobacteria bacterium]|nr:MAG: ribosome-associated translation inhibitor RaiA [Actinomycetota bacterium]TML47906.1 MAG: ribosome-associated translation inhibitor RaiA [Actinomycetota bacterium]TML74644.1 MAG: ribosome-associated translation inhibitor RaiA [Actinomycetota bacterium]
MIARREEPHADTALILKRVPKGQRLERRAMRLQVKAHHERLPESVRVYAEKRLGKLDKRLHDLTLVEVTLSREHNPSISDDHTADGVVHTKGPTLVARESALSYEAAIDRLVDKLERQVERYRDKRTHEPRRTARHREEAPPVPVVPPEDSATEQGDAAA